MREEQLMVSIMRVIVIKVVEVVIMSILAS